jgi:hypothetical protein
VQELLEGMLVDHKAMTARIEELYVEIETSEKRATFLEAEKVDLLNNVETLKGLLHSKDAEVESCKRQLQLARSHTGDQRYDLSHFDIRSQLGDFHFVDHFVSHLHAGQHQGPESVSPLKR